MWNAIPPASQDEPMPPSRSKHSATLLGGHLYLLGGRNGNLPLKDLWRYSFSDGKWQQLKPTGDSPPCLQEHTAVCHRDALYVFGGEVGFSAGNETPLWVYHIKTNSWRKIRTQKGTASPRGRRGHTALSHKGVMLLYGGYRDLRGSSNELWAFHFESETWHLLSAGRNGPPARHKHSAVVHDDGMWIYGGMTDLHERSDLWRFDTVSRTWTAVKAKLNPGSLHSHAVCKLPSSMLLFGGERDGQPTNELWRFHFGTETWERIHTQGIKPQPRSESVALTVSELLLQDGGNQRTSPPIARRLRTGGSMDRSNGTVERSNGAQERRQRWSGGNSFDGCTPSRKQPATPNTNSSNLSILKEISKLSQMNLSRLGSTNKCNYSVLSSTESIASDSSTGGGGSEMVKSQSSNIITKSSNTPCTPGFGVPSFLPRDPVSVPNFSLISSCSLTPVEVTKLVYLDNEEAPIPGPRGSGTSGDTFQTIHNQFQPVRNANNRKLPNFPKSASVRFGNPYVTPEEPSDETSDYASMETMNKSSSYATNGQETTKLSNFAPNNGQEMSKSSNLATNSQEMSKTSNFVINGQEMMNKSSNLATNDSDVMNYVSNCQDSIRSSNGQEMMTKSSNYIINSQDRSGGKLMSFPNSVGKSSKDLPLSFANPNYMAPDLKTILSKKDYVKVLNSPPDSLLEDALGRSNSRQEMVEMKPVPPKSLALTGCCNYNHEMAVEKQRKKNRASSAGRAEQKRAMTSFCVFLIGGKEHGQVTVFKRPLSVWKLMLNNEIY